MIKDVIDKIKAKITGKPVVIGVDIGQQPDRSAEIKINAEKTVIAHLLESDKEEQERKRATRRNTNNWRKMHHLPMRRKTGSRKKVK